MHDPSTLALTVRLPIPSRVSRRRDGRTPGFRWPFWITRRHEVYFGHDLVDVWHEEPGGADSGTVCGHRRLWTHWRHLRFRFPMVRSARRRLFTTCEWCGTSGTRRRPVNVSRQWEREDRGRWWHGERGLYHSECATIAEADAACVCEAPDPGRLTRRCRLCGKNVDYKQAEFRDARLLARAAGRGRRRPTAEDSANISAAFLKARGLEPEETE